MVEEKAEEGCERKRCNLKRGGVGGGGGGRGKRNDFRSF